MSKVKRMCDWPGCIDWGVAALTFEQVKGKPMKGIACQAHLDQLVGQADRERIPVEDHRER